MSGPTIPKGRIESSYPMGPHYLPLVCDLMTQMWHKIPKVDLNKFDGSDPTGWVTQMERYIFIHGIIDDLMKLHVGVLYLNL
jgi:hypothetical protein